VQYIEIAEWIEVVSGPRAFSFNSLLQHMSVCCTFGKKLDLVANSFVVYDPVIICRQDVTLCRLNWYLYLIGG